MAKSVNLVSVPGIVGDVLAVAGDRTAYVVAHGLTVPEGAVFRDSAALVRWAGCQGEYGYDSCDDDAFHVLTSQNDL